KLPAVQLALRWHSEPYKPSCGMLARWPVDRSIFPPTISPQSSRRAYIRMTIPPILELTDEDPIDPMLDLDADGAATRHELITKRINALTEVLKTATSRKSPGNDRMALLAVQNLNQLLMSELSGTRSDG